MTESQEETSQRYPQVWRTKLRSTLLESDGHADQVKYCLDNGCVAFGWAPEGVRRGRGERKLTEVCAAIAEKPWRGWGNPAANQVRRFAEEVQPGDYIWTRDVDGRYLLGKFEDGDWYYEAGGPKSEFRELDLHQFRPVRWARRPLDHEQTPGAVVRSFIGPGQAFRRIGAPEVGRITDEFCWEYMNGRKPKSPSLGAEDAVKSLPPEELEDLVLLWLQLERSFVIVPSSRRRDLPIVEAALVTRNGSKWARPQVKSGEHEKLDWSSVGQAVGHGEIGIGFAASGDYAGTRKKGWIQISTEELATFVESSLGRKVVPERIRFWFGKS